MTPDNVLTALILFFVGVVVLAPRSPGHALRYTRRVFGVQAWKVEVA
jgi:hypothetical protein